MMKTTFKILLLFALFLTVLVSCEKEEDGEGELKIDFKTEEGYVSTDSTVPSGTALKIGIEAETEVSKDPIVKFNISESVNGGTATSVYSEDLEDTMFDYDYNFTLSDTESGNTHKFTFTITNRDGINAQESITITVH